MIHLLKTNFMMRDVDHGLKNPINLQFLKKTN